jgi:serine protease Do
MTTALAIAAQPGASRAFAAELEELARRLREITARIHTRSVRFDGVGAGVHWPVDGGGPRIVVTNAHVVPARRGDTVGVELARGDVADATVVARDRDRDLALLALPDSHNDWPAPAVIADSHSLRVGELVVALGHPFGVAGSLSLGVVHAMPNVNGPLVQADIRLAPGNSGGPLATLDGSVIGINCMIARGLGIAISAQVAVTFVREALGQSSGA